MDVVPVIPTGEGEGEVNPPWGRFHKAFLEFKMPILAFKMPI